MIIDRYLDRVLLYADKPEPESQAIRQELEDHLLQEVEDLTEKGLPREEAILRALRRHGPPSVIGYRLRGRFPWIDIRKRGFARGVIAIGPRAIGIVAIGWVAFGIFAIGAGAVGVFALGGICYGVFSVGGYALGWLFLRAMFNEYNYWVFWPLYLIPFHVFDTLQSREGKADWLIEG